MTTTIEYDETAPAELLGQRKRDTKDSRPDLIALQRWEAEGGALHSAGGIDLRS
ncbi:hypothetical protein MSP7336_00147 [Mycobacterium shimoidei]|uniref:Uncharacterized protein n=1 Tax=Mycobacterium shimoidei TaxID=29313 RepID=A0A375YSW9_MYCSH|nr:hypothetical protein MSP7336_00147 [Mycobacterium shimoidei]